MASFQTKALMVPPVGGNNFGIISPSCMVGWTAFHAPLNAYQTSVWFVRELRVRSLCKGWNKQRRSDAPSVDDPKV